MRRYTSAYVNPVLVQGSLEIIVQMKKRLAGGTLAAAVLMGTFVGGTSAFAASGDLTKEHIGQGLQLQKLDSKGNPVAGVAFQVVLDSCKDLNFIGAVNADTLEAENEAVYAEWDAFDEAERAKDKAEAPKVPLEDITALSQVTQTIGEKRVELDSTTDPVLKAELQAAFDLLLVEQKRLEGVVLTYETAKSVHSANMATWRELNEPNFDTQGQIESGTILKTDKDGKLPTLYASGCEVQLIEQSPNTGSSTCEIDPLIATFPEYVLTGNLPEPEPEGPNTMPMSLNEGGVDALAEEVNADTPAPASIKGAGVKLGAFKTVELEVLGEAPILGIFGQQSASVTGTEAQEDCGAAVTPEPKPEPKPETEKPEPKPETETPAPEPEKEEPVAEKPQEKDEPVIEPVVDKKPVAKDTVPVKIDSGVSSESGMLAGAGALLLAAAAGGVAFMRRSKKA